MDFETGIVKWQGGNVTALSREEENAVSILKLESHGDNENEEDGLAFAECAFKRQKVRQEREQEYSDAHFGVRTSNVCDRLFSIMVHALSDRRKGTTPAHFECQVFLNANRDLKGPDYLDKLCTA